MIVRLQAGGIELVLPAPDATGEQRSFSLRETTDNSAPSFMFADLEGRLSELSPLSSSASSVHKKRMTDA